MAHREPYPSEYFDPIKYNHNVTTGTIQIGLIDGAKLRRSNACGS